jgi:peroxiredoxin
MSGQAAIYFQAKKAFREACETAAMPGSADNVLDAAVLAFQTAGKTVTLPLVQSEFDRLLSEIPTAKQFLNQRENEGNSVLNKPAPDWKAPDLNGKEHRLADYRGKVVVIDFWYRGCGWCMVAMPQIKEVAEHFRDKPVAVLGMSKDHDWNDAKFVAEKLALNYPVLMAEGVPEKYGVEGYPTLFVIDGYGIVRKREVGYSPTLRDDLVKTIDGILAEPAK